VTKGRGRSSAKPEAEPEPRSRARGRKVEDPGKSSELPPPMPATSRRGRSSQQVTTKVCSQQAVTGPDKENNGKSTRRSVATAGNKAEKPNIAAAKKGRGRKDSHSSNVSNNEAEDALSDVSKQTNKSTKPVKAVSSSRSNGSVGRKRKAEETPEGSSSKKRVEEDSDSGSVRSRQNSSMDSNASPSLRKVESLTKKHLVMFTGYNDQNDVKLVKELKGSTTDSLTSCTVLVTDQIRRTAKFLSMVARGIPIVSPQWLTESKRSGKFLDPWEFTLKDPTNEKKWGFKLEETLRKATRAPLLAGLQIHVTEKVKPSPEQCKDFIECGGGVFLETLPTQPIPGLYIVSCSEDKKLTSDLAKMKVPIMDKEWMLSGLLKYKLEKSLKLK